MRDIISVVASVDATLAKFRRGMISWDTVCEIFNEEWENNLYKMMREVREIEGGR